MELKELAEKLGVQNILVTSYDSMTYKDNITVIVNDDLLFHLVGKTVSFIPLSKNGINKSIKMNVVKEILDSIKLELSKK